MHTDVEDLLKQIRDHRARDFYIDYSAGIVDHSEIFDLDKPYERNCLWQWERELIEYARLILEAYNKFCDDQEYFEEECEAERTRIEQEYAEQREIIESDLSEQKRELRRKIADITERYKCLTDPESAEAKLWAMRAEINHNKMYLNEKERELEGYADRLAERNEKLDEKIRKSSDELNARSVNIDRKRRQVERERETANNLRHTYDLLMEELKQREKVIEEREKALAIAAETGDRFGRTSARTLEL